jgi:hypothetical protein
VHRVSVKANYVSDTFVFECRAGLDLRRQAVLFGRAINPLPLEIDFMRRNILCINKLSNGPDPGIAANPLSGGRSCL